MRRSTHNPRSTPRVKDAPARAGTRLPPAGQDNPAARHDHASAADAPRKAKAKDAARRVRAKAGAKAGARTAPSVAGGADVPTVRTTANAPETSNPTAVTVEAAATPARKGKGGRPPGSRNKRTIELIDKAVASGETPLDYLLRIMRDPRRDELLRLDAAKAAAPYVHPKLAQTELNLNANLKSMTDAQLDAELAELTEDPAIRALVGRTQSQKVTAH